MRADDTGSMGGVRRRLGPARLATYQRTNTEQDIGRGEGATRYEGLQAEFKLCTESSPERTEMLRERLVPLYSLLSFTFFFHPAPSPEGGARVGGAVRMEGPEHPFLGVWPRQEGPRPRLPPTVLLWLRHHLRTGYQVPGPWGKVHCRNHSALNVDQVRSMLGNAVNVRTRAV